MGCDIHCYIEHTWKGDKPFWQAFGGRINPGRDYETFGLLAGVRWDVEHPPLRNVPESLSWNAGEDWWLRVVDKPTSWEAKEASLEDAMRWGASGSTLRFKNNDPTSAPMYVSHPDYHSASWLTPDEFEACLAKKKHPADPGYAAIIAACRALEHGDRIVRIVFWFDN